MAQHVLLDGLLLGGQYQDVDDHRVFRFTSIIADAPEHGELKDLICRLPDNLTYRVLSIDEDIEKKIKEIAEDRIDEYRLLSIQFDGVCGREPFVVYSIEMSDDGSVLEYHKRELRPWPPEYCYIGAPKITKEKKYYASI